jgi:hypothetical protein
VLAEFTLNNGVNYENKFGIAGRRGHGLGLERVSEFQQHGWKRPAGAVGKPATQAGLASPSARHDQLSAAIGDVPKCARNECRATHDERKSADAKLPS